MKKINDLDPSNFILLHINDPEPKLKVGLTIYFDKNGNYKRIPLDKFVRDIDERYITQFEGDGSIIFWQVLGYRK